MLAAGVTENRAPEDASAYERVAPEDVSLGASAAASGIPPLPAAPSIPAWPPLPARGLSSSLPQPASTSAPNKTPRAMRLMVPNPAPALRSTSRKNRRSEDQSGARRRAPGRRNRRTSRFD